MQHACKTRPREECDDSRHEIAKTLDPRKTSLISVVILCGLILIVFSSIVHFGFIQWDDEKNFVDNPWVKGFLQPRYWIWAWTTRLLAVYQPISWTFLQAQYAASPKNPAAVIHTVSLLLHMANAIIVFILYRTLSKSSEPNTRSAALCGALYFALHPLQCEVVAWASCQPYLLASFWGGLCLLCFLKSIETPENHRWYQISVVLFAASLLSKSIFVSLPAILAILRFSHGRQSKGTFSTFSIIRRDWIFWFLSFCAFNVSMWARRGDSSEGAMMLVQTLKLVPASLGFFLEKSVFPSNLSPLYEPSLATWIEIILGILLLAGTLVCLSKRKHRPIGLLPLALIVLLLPGLAAAHTEGILFADRYAYLPNVVMGLLISMILYQFQKVRNGSALPAQLCAVFLTVGLAIPSKYQVALWSDSLRFWQHAGQNKTALSHQIHNNLGLALARRGQIDDAIAHYKKALEIKPYYAEAHINLGNVLYARGQIDDAIAHYEKALEIKPYYAEAHINLGAAFAGRGQIDEAIAHYEKTLQINPDFAEVHINLGAAFAGRGQIDDAIAHYEKALEIKPYYAEAHNNLGVAFAGRGQIDDAIAHYEKALEIEPDNADAHYNLGVALASRGQIDDAIAHYEKALQIKHDHVGARQNLEIALQATHRKTLKPIIKRRN
jgi:tetratricopeptide (TPR) repeat protein